MRYQISFITLALLALVGNHHLHPSFLSVESAEVYMCGSILKLKSNLIDSIISGEGISVNGSLSNCDWNLRKDKVGGDLLLNLYPKGLSVNHGLYFCGFYVPEDRIVSKEAFPNCLRLFETSFSEEGIGLVNLKVLIEGDDPISTNATWYEEQITPYVEKLDFRLVDVNSFGDFFSNSSSGLGKGIKYLKSLNITIMMEFQEDFPKLFGDTLDEAINLKNLLLNYTEICGRVNQDIWMGKSSPYSLGSVRVASKGFETIQINAPCVHVDDLSIPHSDLVTAVALSFSNLGDLFVEKQIHHPQSSSSPVDFENVFWSLQNCILISLKFTSFTDRNKTRNLSKSFFNYRLQLSVEDPRRRLVYLLVEYHHFVPKSLRVTNLPWSAGISSDVTSFHIDATLMNDEMIDVLEGLTGGVAVEEDHKKAVHLILKDLVWNTTGTVRSNLSFVYTDIVLGVPVPVESLNSLDWPGPSSPPSSSSRPPSSFSSFTAVDVSGLVKPMRNESSSRLAIDCRHGRGNERLKVDNMSQLATLRISYCTLESNIDWESLNLKHVTHLDLERVPGVGSSRLLARLFPCANTLQDFEEQCCFETGPLPMSFLRLVAVDLFPFRHLTRGMFCRMPLLRELSLQRLGLETIASGSFERSRNLAFIDLRSNEFRDLPAMLLKNQPREVRRFDFSKNQLSHIAHDFCKNTTVKHLNLAENLMKRFTFLDTLRTPSFRPMLPPLEEHQSQGCAITSSLNISHNMISYLEVIAGVGGSNATSRHPRTFILDASGSHIERVHFVLNTNATTTTVTPQSTTVPTALIVNLSNNSLKDFKQMKFEGLRLLSILNLSRNQLTDGVDGSGREEDEEETFLIDSCKQYGCVVDLSHNFLSDSSNQKLMVWFRNSFVRTLDLSFNMFLRFPSEATKLPFSVPLTPLESDLLDKALLHGRDFYLTIRLTGNKIVWLDSPLCMRGLDAESSKVYYDFSAMGVDFVSDQIWKCQDKAVVATSVLMLNLNNNPLSCFPVSPPHGREGRMLHLLSLLNTNVSDFSCHWNLQFPYIVSLLIGFSDSKIVSVGDGGGDDPQQLPRCCTLSKVVVAPPAINPLLNINPEVSPRCNLIRLINRQGNVGRDESTCMNAWGYFANSTYCRYQRAGDGQSVMVASLETYQNDAFLVGQCRREQLQSTCLSGLGKCVPPGYEMVEIGIVEYFVVVWFLVFIGTYCCTVLVLVLRMWKLRDDDGDVDYSNFSSPSLKRKERNFLSSNYIYFGLNITMPVLSLKSYGTGGEGEDAFYGIEVTGKDAETAGGGYINDAANVSRGAIAQPSYEHYVPLESTIYAPSVKHSSRDDGSSEILSPNGLIYTFRLETKR